MKETFPKLCGSLSGEASKLGVKMHNAGYEAQNLDYTYIAMGSMNLEETLKAVRELYFRGLGVSIPFKESIIPLLDEVGDDVEQIGACNTVVFEDGKAKGFNTDWRGAIRALEETADLKEVEKAEIIGSGGVARAIAYGLKQEGIEVFISARNREQREKLVQELELSGSSNLKEQGERGAELVVNATPVADSESPVKLEKHESGEWLLDVVFQDLETEIIRDAEEKGWNTTPGWRMLLHQALEQFELYTGKDAPKEEMGEVLENALK